MFLTLFLCMIFFGRVHSQHPTIHSIYNQTYASFDWYTENSYEYQYKFTEGEIVLSEGNLTDSFINFDYLIPNTNYIFYLKSIINDRNFDNYNIQTLNYLELSPPNILYSNNNQISISLDPYFYDYPMYEFINTTLLAKSLNTSLMFYIYNGVFQENINITDYRFVNNIYQIKRYIVNNLNTILIESNDSNKFNIFIPTTSTVSTQTITTQSVINTSNTHNNNELEFTWVIILITILASILALILIWNLGYIVHNNYKIKQDRLNRINHNTFSTYNPEFNPNVDSTSIYATTHPNIVPRNMMFE